MKKMMIICWIWGMMALCCHTMSLAADCPDCKEVAKGKIPAKFLEKSLKTLPNGIAVWDIEEAVPVLRQANAACLWVDTRPKSMYKMGTVKGAVNLVCDLEGIPIPEPHGTALTQERLLEAMKQINADTDAVTVVYFCQGPECHRSFDAALRTVQNFGIPLQNVVWFRDGYPVLEKYVMDNPKLKKRMDLYLQGDVLN